MDGTHFVGRKDLINRILGGTPGAGAFYELRGITGAGKSALLEEVARLVTGVGDVVAHLRVEDYFSTLDLGSSDVGESRLDGEVQRLNLIWHGIVELMPAGNQAVDLQEFFDETQRRLGDPGQAGPAGPSGFSGEGFHDASHRAPAAPDEQIARLLRTVRTELNGMVAAQVAQGKRVFLLVDTFELVRHRRLGEWLIDLFRGLHQVVVVVAWRQGTHDQDILPGAVATLEVPGLSPEEVQSLLAGELGAPLAQQLATAVSRFTDGHALAVKLVADLTRQRQRAGEQVGMDNIRELMRQPAVGDRDPDRLLSRLVGNILALVEQQDPAVRQGFDCLWVVRRFNMKLLHHLLGISANAGPADRKLVHHLLDHSFVKQHSTPGQSEAYYVIHQFIRLQGLATLETDPQRLQALHRSAEGYYREQTGQYFFTNYNSWLTYESPEWQALVREWLYHVANLDEPGRHKARLGLAGLFMDAFWWHGSYAPFRFCEELLTDWAEVIQARADREADQLWGTTLRRLYELYPKGWRHDDADWRSIRRLLLYMRKTANLDDEQSLGDAQARRLRALSDYYLATANQHLDPHDPSVDELMRDAARRLADDNDDTNGSYMSVYIADAALARGDLPAALEAVRGELAGLAQADDGEIPTNVHRIYADVLWARGERARALDCMARAAAWAYRFQTLGVALGQLMYVDNYDQAFLREIHERTTDRLAELIAAGQPDLACDACRRIRAFFKPYWDLADGPQPQDPAALLTEEGAEAAVAAMYPPPPADADLNRYNTPYLLQAADVVDRLTRTGAFDKSPGTPISGPAAFGR
jgi:hypothetical protein